MYTFSKFGVVLKGQLWWGVTAKIKVESVLQPVSFLSRFNTEVNQIVLYTINSGAQSLEFSIVHYHN